MNSQSLVGALFFTWAMWSAGWIQAEEYSAEQVDFFESKIRPVLIKECYGCHSNKTGNARGGLRLDTRELTHIGGSSGPAVVPGDLDESLLYNAIIHEDFVMPPKRKLSANVIKDFRTWIEMGAPDPRESEVQPINPTVTVADIKQARESFWAYQQPQKVEAPPCEDNEWPINDIDRFVLSKLEESDLEPAADAPPHQILRRLCFDLIGLPPTPEQIEFFESLWKKSPEQAIAMVVDRLLDSPQFGERWGRHWLDVVRYAESTGREVNMTYPHAWRYRDFVIDSFNADKPFNEFVQQQIAGDLMPAKTDEAWSENLIATTFLAMGAKNVNEQNRVQFQADLVDEQIDATTRVFMGMSVSCARCHDHKFDAFSQADYYALAGVFSNATTYFGNPPSDLGSFSTPQRKRQSSLIRLPIDDPSEFDRSYSKSELADLRSEMQALMDDAANLRRNRSSGGNANAQRQRIALANKLSDLSAKLAVVDSDGQPISYCMGVQERTAPRDVPILVRGEIDLQSNVVDRGLPLVFDQADLAINSDESGRLAVARWLGSRENPLTARVMVNRIWQNLMGQGLVGSTENFGVTGQFPSHPDLLDYLAVQFQDHNWSTKSVIRAITTSRLYRLSTEFSEYAHELDPDNRLLWRANPRRLDAEALRDAMLSISGELDTERPRGSLVAQKGYVRVRDGILGDPREAARSAFQGMRNRARGSFTSSRRGGPFQRRAGQPFDRSNAGDARNELAQAMRNISHQLDMEDAKFRSVYLPIVRDNIPRSLDVFDFADANTIVGTREKSNTPNQALYMLNNPFVIQQSMTFANKIAEHSSNLREQIDYAFHLAYGRSATSREQQLTSAFFRSFNASSVQRQRFRSATNDQLALSTFCQSLFASAEFRFLD